jgi:hypothetical protein
MTKIVLQPGHEPSKQLILEASIRITDRLKRYIEALLAADPEAQADEIDQLLGQALHREMLLVLREKYPAVAPTLDEDERRAAMAWAKQQVDASWS